MRIRCVTFHSIRRYRMGGSGVPENPSLQPPPGGALLAEKTILEVT